MRNDKCEGRRPFNFVLTNSFWSIFI